MSLLYVIHYLLGVLKNQAVTCNPNPSVSHIKLIIELYSWNELYIYYIVIWVGVLKLSSSTNC